MKKPILREDPFFNVAASFVEARRALSSLSDYPGTRPLEIADAYDLQNAAIRLWGELPSGWKVGRILGADADRFGTDRLAGPIFPGFIFEQTKRLQEMGVFRDGFAAVEGEIVAILAADAPPTKVEWTTSEAATLIASLHAGAEIASSPYAGINADGPLVTISDFGNNNGLIIGSEIPNWRDMKFEDWTCQTFIDGNLIGEGAPDNIPGGPVESLRFLLENTARRGYPLKKNTAVCTGAITGVHQIKPNQKARINFAGAEPIEFTIVDAAELEAARASEQGIPVGGHLAR